MSKRIARIIGRKSTRSGTRKKPLIHRPLPYPQDDEGEVHRHQDENEEKIETMKKCEGANGIETRVIPEEIPAPNERIKMFAIRDAIFVADLTFARISRKGRFDVRVQSDDPSLD